MNLRKSIAATLAAGTILLSTMMGAAAQQGSVSIGVGNGGFDTYVEYMGFNPVTYSFEDQSTGGVLQLRTSNMNGSGAWSVQFTMGNFTSNTSSDVIQLTDWNLSSTGFTLVNGIDAANGHAFNNAPNYGVWSAPANASEGDYRMTANGQIEVPGGTDPGAYTSTIGVTASSYPGQ